MKRYIRSTNYLEYIPKKYRQHIESIEVSDSDDYNSRGQRLKNYTVTWDDGDVHEFQNVEQMIHMIRNYTDEDGYYSAP